MSRVRFPTHGCCSPKILLFTLVSTVILTTFMLPSAWPYYKGSADMKRDLEGSETTVLDAAIAALGAAPSGPDGPNPNGGLPGSSAEQAADQKAAATGFEMLKDDDQICTRVGGTAAMVTHGGLNTCDLDRQALGIKDTTFATASSEPGFSVFLAALMHEWEHLSTWVKERGPDDPPTPPPTKEEATASREAPAYCVEVDVLKLRLNNPPSGMWTADQKRNLEQVIEFKECAKAFHQEVLGNAEEKDVWVTRGGTKRSRFSRDPKNKSRVRIDHEDDDGGSYRYTRELEFDTPFDNIRWMEVMVHPLLGNDVLIVSGKYVDGGGGVVLYTDPDDDDLINPSTETLLGSIPDPAQIVARPANGLLPPQIYVLDRSTGQVLVALGSSPTKLPKSFNSDPLLDPSDIHSCGPLNGMLVFDRTSEGIGIEVHLKEALFEDHDIFEETHLRFVDANANFVRDNNEVLEVIGADEYLPGPAWGVVSDLQHGDLTVQAFGTSGEVVSIWLTDEEGTTLLTQLATFSVSVSQHLKPQTIVLSKGLMEGNFVVALGSDGTPSHRPRRVNPSRPQIFTTDRGKYSPIDIVTITGRNFSASSQVTIAGEPMPVTFDSTTRLRVRAPHPIMGHFATFPIQVHDGGKSSKPFLIGIDVAYLSVRDARFMLDKLPNRGRIFLAKLDEIDSALRGEKYQLARSLSVDLLRLVVNEVNQQAVGETTKLPAEIFPVQTISQDLAESMVSTISELINRIPQ